MRSGSNSLALREEAENRELRSMEYLTYLMFYFPRVLVVFLLLLCFVFLSDVFIFLWKEEKPHLFPEWRKTEPLAKPHFPHI